MARSIRSVSTTRVVIRDDLHGTTREYFSPQTPKEVLCNNLEVVRAIRWVDAVEMLEWTREEQDGNVVLLNPEPSLRVSIRHDANTVIVHWFAAGDPSQAAEEYAHAHRKGGVS